MKRQHYVFLISFYFKVACFTAFFYFFSRLSCLSLDDKGIIIPNPEKDEDPELDMESPANIYGEDYDSLSTSLENLLQSWKVIEPSEPVSNLDVDVLWLYYMWWTICAEYFDN